MTCSQPADESARPARPELSGGRSRRWFWLAMGCLAAAALLTCVVRARSRVGSDEDIFRYVGYAWVTGHDLPYRDAYENKPPAIFLYWGLMQQLGSRGEVIERLLGVLATCLTALLLRGAATRLWRSTWGGLACLLFIVGACSAALDYPYGDTETLGGLFAVAGLALVLAVPAAGCRVVRAMLGGLLVGIAVTFKPVYGVEVLVLLAILATAPVEDGRRRLRAVAAAAAGAAAPMAAWLLYFHARGAAREFLEIVVLSLAGVGTQRSAVGLQRVDGFLNVLAKLSFPGLLVPLVLAGSAALGAGSRLPGRLACILTGWFGLALAVIGAQGWGWGHQFKQLLPPLCLLAPGVVFLRGGPAEVGKNGRLRGNAALTLALIGSLLAVVSFCHRPGTRSVKATTAAAAPEEPTPGRHLPWSTVEDAIQATTAPGERIWCYPRAEFYTRAGRLSATRHFMPMFLGVPGARAEVQRMLAAGRARLVAINWPLAAAGQVDPTFSPELRLPFEVDLKALMESEFAYVGETAGWSLYQFAHGDHPSPGATMGGGR